MVKKYILFLILSVFFIDYSYGQTVTEEFYDDEQEGYITHDAVPGVAGAEVSSSLNQFQKDSLLSDDENSLVQAVFSNDAKTAESLLKKGVSPNVLYSFKQDNETTYKTTLLHIIIANNEREILKTVLSYDNISINQLGFSSISKQNKSEYVEITPVAYAVYLNRVNMVEALLKKDADANKYGKDSFPAIFYAKDKKILNMLRSHDADFNILVDNNTRPLFEAVKSNNSQLVSMLLDYGADVNKKDGNSNTLLYTAITLGYYELARYLIDNGGKIDEPSGSDKVTPLMATLGRHDHDTGFLRYLIFKGANVNAKDKFNRTPIFYIDNYTTELGKSNTIESVEILMENKADINAKDNKGNTILHIKPHDYYKIYAKYNPNINIQNNDGNTPLHIAAMQDNVSYILTGSPDRSIKNKKGQTALNIAEQKHFNKTASLLRLSNAESLLMLGALFGDKNLVDKAISSKVDVNKEILGELPVFYAAKGGNPDVFVKLIVAGAKLNMVPNLVYEVVGSFTESKDQNNRVELSKIFIEREVALNWDKYKDFLHILVREQSEKNKGQGYIRTVLAYAVSNGANPNLLDGKGSAPIHIVSNGQYESYDLTLELISGGANVDMLDSAGYPAIYYCAKAPYNKNDVFLALLNNTKTDINARYGSRENTLLMEAAENGNAKIVMMLVARGADDTLQNKEGKTALMLVQEKFSKKYANPSVDEKNSADYKNYKFLSDVFLADKNTVAECRSGINEECKKYYKPVEVIRPAS